MRNLWDDKEAATFPGLIGQRVYSSRLLGREKGLVLHGGGNTSVKVTEPDRFGEPQELLYVKGSGWDLEFIEAAGFAPVRLAPVRRLAQLPALSDPDMVSELRAQMTQPSAPTPSVETILHAVLPQVYVDHTHADAILSITNTDDGERRVRDLFGDRVVYVPYVMPGFDLARDCARLYAAHAHAGTLGMVLIKHGMFTFGATARESYDRMIDLISEAEDYLARQGAWQVRWDSPAPGVSTLGQAGLRREISAAAGRPLLLRRDPDSAGLALARDPRVTELALQGPATPDHVIRTKRVPMIGRDVAAYTEAYRAYFARHAALARSPLTMLDPAPRVVLDPELGLCTAGDRAADALAVAQIYRRTMDVIRRADALGGYRALPEADLFDMEYWVLEQAKLARPGKRPEFQGEIALVTGAASGIGKACCAALLARGAAVAGIDRDPAVVDAQSGPAWLGLVADVTDDASVDAAIAGAVDAFGGLDMLILNAGVFPGGRAIADLDDEEWRRVMAVNTDANLALLRRAYPLLRLAPGGGRVVVIGSKNVPAPGPGAAAYSASKAALTQLMRVAALEWGRDGIRVNALHPDAVFDTGIWTPEVLAARAAHYGMSVEDYRRRNVLRREVTSHDVAELAAAMCGALFACTTGAQLPIDGGNERVI